MTVLSACQQAAVKLNQTQPTAVYSATDDEFAAELALAANETAEALLQASDWQALITLATLTGDGSAEEFDLPDDYDRMPKKAQVHSLTWQNALFRPAADLDEWLYINDLDLTGTPGNWIIYGDQFRIFPAMATGETARFYYISNLIVTPAPVAANKVAFTADTDTFVLSEKLLRLGIVWRWRANKRMEYAEDLANFEIALADEIGKDKGSKILTVGRVRMPANAVAPYPGTITS